MDQCINVIHSLVEVFTKFDCVLLKRIQTINSVINHSAISSQVQFIRKMLMPSM